MVASSAFNLGVPKLDLDILQKFFKYFSMFYLPVLNTNANQEGKSSGEKNQFQIDCVTIFLKIAEEPNSRSLGGLGVFSIFFLPSSP